METNTTRWSINKGFDEVIDTWPLMSNPVLPLTIVASYLVFVLYLGPAYMKNQPPYKLKKTILIYNICQVFMSLYIVSQSYSYIVQNGIVYEECALDHEDTKNKFYFGLWFYLITKVTELLDTVFFVLRKKYNQVTFLHVYHHAVLVVGSWLYLKYSPSEHSFFTGFINSFVHVIMYTYYTLAALGPSLQPYLFWKKYLTSLQLIQFLLIMIQMISAYFISSCPPPVFWVYWFVGHMILFIYLFAKFYIKTYNVEKKTN